MAKHLEGLVEDETDSDEGTVDADTDKQSQVVPDRKSSNKRRQNHSGTEEKISRSLQLTWTKELWLC